LEGLWVAGECAATGLHGANRLASNSLLEGLVFGARAAEDIKNSTAPGRTRGFPPAPAATRLPAPPHVLRHAMSLHVGMERDAAGLGEALAAIARLERTTGEPALLNMLAAAKLVTAGALMRQESRGGHWRSDFPLTDRTGKRNFMTLGDAQRIAAGAPAPLRRARP
jgi:L-aspartate oxidase